MVTKIVKRSGKVVEFDSSRIAKAMKGALIASKTAFTQKRIDEMERDAVALLENEYEKDGIVTVENAQDCAEKVLMLHGHYDAAKAFILYRQRHSDVREITGQIDDSVRKFGVENITDTMGAVDVVEFADPSNNNELLFDSMKNQNASTQNGTIGYSVLETYARSAKTFWTQTYDPDIIRRSQVDGGNGELYLHDMGWVGGYCSGWSLKDLLLRGLSGVPNKIASAPAKHLSTLCNQMVNFLGILQNEWAGAQAFSSFDTYLAPFVKKDNMSYKEVKQCIQSFIYGVNTPSRWGCQAPFTNVTLDWTCPHDMKDLPAIVGGKEMDFTYGDCKKEMDIVNRAFIEVMIGGDDDGRGFQYPIKVAA